ncbi:MAG: hypothetical protein AAF773_21910 [Cyanobacteria bacterium P01_D01_bin.115]
MPAASTIALIGPPTEQLQHSLTPDGQILLACPLDAAAHDSAVSGNAAAILQIWDAF